MMFGLKASLTLARGDSGRTEAMPAPDEVAGLAAAAGDAAATAGLAETAGLAAADGAGLAGDAAAEGAAAGLGASVGFAAGAAVFVVPGAADVQATTSSPSTLVPSASTNCPRLIDVAGRWLSINFTPPIVPGPGSSAGRLARLWRQ